MKKYGYCWTINNYTAEDLAQVKALESDGQVRYLCYGKEVAPTTGTPHLQGYIHYHSRVVFSNVTRKLTRSSVRGAEGSAEQNRTYCSKGGDFYEFGDCPMTQTEKGKRGREYWLENLSLAKRGRVEECDPKLQITHHQALHAISARYCPMPSDLATINNDWFYGPTGCGKSHTARNDHPGAYLKMCNKWWDGYQNEENVIIEDFDKSHKVLGHHIKIWGDRYSFPAEIKGSKVNLRPQRIIITSNWTPQEIWGDEPQTLEPILRRYNVIYFPPRINTPTSP